LAADPSQIDIRSAPAAQRARELFSWDAKAGQVKQVYDWLTNGRQSAQPCFPMPLVDTDQPAQAFAEV
jgi:hypothetical protein